MNTQEIHIGGRMSILPQNIILLEGDANYTKLYLLNGESLIVATTLKKLEERFMVLQNFFRSHKSHIINLNYLLDFKEDSNEITMQNHKKALLSRRRRDAFHLKINDIQNP
jgi:DNA-binding LytR/AlgR family response regulator